MVARIGEPEVRVCSWCNSIMEWLIPSEQRGMCLDLDAYTISHGLCPACRKNLEGDCQNPTDDPSL